MPKQGNSVIYKHKNRFKCSYCIGYEATSKKALNLHVKYTHSIEKATQGSTTYMCNTCKKEFGKSINLRSHIRKTHM